MLEMEHPRPLDLPRLDQPGVEELADRLEEAVPRRPVSVVDTDDRLVDQVGEEVEHPGWVDAVIGGDGLGGIEREVGHHGESPGDHLLVGREEVVAPRDRGFERLLAREGRPAPAGQEPKAVVERRLDAAGAHHPDPRRGELDGQRDAVEAIDDPGDRGQFVVARVEVRTCAVSALHEQLDARIPIERGNAPRRLPRDTQSFAARGQDAERRASPQQLVDEWPHATEYVLAVVEHDQTVELPQRLGEGVDDRPPELLAKAEHLGELGGDALRITDRCQLDTPHPVGRSIELGPPHLVRQPGLPATSRSRDRQQSLLTDLRSERDDFGRAPDETRQRQRQVGPAREIVVQSAHHDRF